jgi:hypothetical protein
MVDGVLQIVKEYRSYQETGRSPAAKKGSTCLPDGRALELCTKGDAWALCLVRPGDDALTPVAAGKKSDRVLAVVEALTARWDPSMWPPLAVFIEGAARVFVPAGRSSLLGVIEFKQGALLLGVVTRAESSDIALVHLVGTRPSVLHVGAPMDLRAVNMDVLLALQAEPHPEDGELSTEILAAFARLSTRATARMQPVTLSKEPDRRRGIGGAELLVWLFVQFARTGQRDPVGHLGEIARRLKASVPDLDFPDEALGDALAWMIEAKTCLVSRRGRIWRIHTWGLLNSGSALYRKFCGEAAAVVVDVYAFITALNARPTRMVRPGARSRGRGAPSIPEVPSHKDAAQPAPAVQPVLDPAAIDDKPTSLAVAGMVLQEVGRLLMPGAPSDSPSGLFSPSTVPAAVPGISTNETRSTAGPAVQPARKLFMKFENEWFEIKKDEFVIGRVQKVSDLVIKDAKMSRRHCSIVRRNDDFFIKDLGSTNGIEFQGARVDNHKIVEGSVYSLCDHEVRFSFIPASS